MDKNSKIFNWLLIGTLILAIPLSVFLAIKRTNFFGRAFGEKADLVVDMGSSYAVDGQIWRNLAQGGEEKEPMLTNVATKVKTLGPKYIRVDHIFDFYDVVGRNGDELVFGWAKLDRLISDIQAAGATPFISISYMPAELSSGGTTDYPRSWSEWEFAVKSLVERYSGFYGIANIYYEVWNEPDMLGDFKTYGDKNYLTLYESTVYGATSATNVKPFKIGGPATTGMYTAWMTDLADFAKKKNLRLDFLSWHRYSYSLDDFEKDWLGIVDAIAQTGYEKPVELVVSEFGHTPEKDPGYDTNFSAVHTLAVSATLENRIDKLFLFEIKDGPGDAKFTGSWGLFTHDKFGEPVAKPRVNALYFLNKMKGERVNVAGSGSWVKAFAKKEGDIVRLFVVNYDPSGKHYEAVPIKLINLKSGNVSVKRKDFLSGEKTRNYQIEESELEIVEGFDANSAAIFEITSI